MASQTRQDRNTTPSEHTEHQITMTSTTITTSPRRHIASLDILQQYKARAIVIDDVVVGIEIGDGYQMRTNQGPIADEQVLSSWTHALEEQAQYDSEMSQQRRLCLPEMVFCHAHVLLEYDKMMTLKLDAYQALQAWACAHSQIPMQNSTQQEQHYTGVDILKTCDAELWMSKNKNNLVNHSTKRSMFHYDWTFSTPHAWNNNTWTPRQESGFDTEMLQDTSVPILFFDSIVLYEDDLHDNGQVSLSAKVRVMPSFILTLQRLLVRVDGVTIRVRDVRCMVIFHKNKMYRDVVWRECPWDALNRNGLPSDVRTWRLAEEEGQQQRLQTMISKVPQVDLPSGLCPFAELRVPENNETRGNNNVVDETSSP